MTQALRCITTLRRVIDRDGSAADHRDWLSELASSATPATQSSPGPSLLSEVSSLRAEVNALKALLSEPRESAGAEVLTASALVELQVEVSQLRESLQAIGARSVDRDWFASAIQEISADDPGERLAAVEAAVVQVGNEVRAALAEQESRLGDALIRIASDLAKLRNALLG
jgi:hypothetical protein